MYWIGEQVAQLNWRSLKSCSPHIVKLILTHISGLVAPISTCDIFLKRGLIKDLKNDTSLCRTHKYKNTKTQIHKYTNTVNDQLLERPIMWYIFEKRIDQGSQKWYFLVPNAQIQKYKDTNTQIHKYSKWSIARKTQHVVYFWKED